MATPSSSSRKLLRPRKPGCGLRLRAAVDVDHDRSPAREPGGWHVQEARDRTTVEALPAHELGLGERGGIEPAGLALGPPLDLSARHVDGEHVGRRAGRRQREPDFPAVLMPLERADYADRHARDHARGTTRGVDQPQAADAVLVRDDGDRPTVGGHVVEIDVPGNVGHEVAMLAGGDIEVSEALKLGAAIGRDPKALSVGAPLGAAVGHQLSVRLRREQRLSAGRDVRHPQVALVDRDVLEHREPGVIGRPVLGAPATALEREDAPVGRGILRIDDIDVPVGAVAACRAVRHAVAGMRPRPEVVLRAAAVADQGRHAARDIGAEDLPEFVSSPVAREHEILARATWPARAGDALREERELATCSAREADLVDLVGVGEARQHQGLAPCRVPAREARRAELRVPPHRSRDRGRQLRHSVRVQVGRGGDDRGRRGLCLSRCRRLRSCIGREREHDQRREYQYLRIHRHIAETSVPTNSAQSQITAR